MPQFVVRPTSAKLIASVTLMKSSKKHATTAAKQKFYKPIPKGRRKGRAKSWLIRFAMNETQHKWSTRRKVALFVTIKSPSSAPRDAVQVVIPHKKLRTDGQSDIDFFKRSKFMIECVATNEEPEGGREAATWGSIFHASLACRLPPFVSFSSRAEPLSQSSPDALPTFVAS